MDITITSIGIGLDYNEEAKIGIARLQKQIARKI